ncbi:MAG: UDP-N-acetylglucosamine 2-epimerase (hydrolyzing) [Pyrinomonadaceae bacterium]|nr:UDP-N-acetylglucosamine 2-epimerase (hydrolyzing) [Sphingobacteriaceae bacterium]
MMKICVATGTRAEYGLLKPLIDQINIEPDWQLQLLVTGTHLSPEFGLTYQQIEKDGLKIDAKVEMLLSSDTAEGIVKSMGLGMIGYADAFKNLQPDLLILLGDRYEMLAVASSALIFKIPIAHLHGGEITEGAYDDAIRHAITKMSHLHFTSTEAYSDRVIQLGEKPGHVFNVGAIGLDNIANLKLLTKEELEIDLKIEFLKYNYQVTFHPATLDHVAAAEQFQELLNAIDQQQESFFIFTKANADTDGRLINQMIDQYVAQQPGKAVAFASLGTLKFLSVLKICDAIVGNSSSGIIEAPSVGIPTINIGDRQKGRIQAETVINCEAISSQITQAFERSKNEEFKKTVSLVVNLYGNGFVSQQIVKAIKTVNLKDLVIKTFNNLA